MSARQTRADGKPRNQWALWMARRARLDGRPETELMYEKRADELSYEEQRATAAAKEREFARKWRAAGGDEAYAQQHEARADELERPIVFPWPPGTSRALAERVAQLMWADMPVADAPDAVLAGLLDSISAHKPQLVQQARAELLDNGFSDRYAAAHADAEAKSKAQRDAFHRQIDEQRITVKTDGEEPDPFDPVNHGAGEYASPPPGAKKKRRR